MFFFFFQAEDGIRDLTVTGVQTCALPICFLLEGAQQLPLQLWGEAVDLVEEQRAAFGDFEQAGLGGPGVGERAALVAEQLALEQGRRESGTVRSEERRVGEEGRFRLLAYL